jgi:Flp pilus assembly protein TadG
MVSSRGMMSRILAYLRDCCGSTAEEIALVTPIFVLILLLTFELGYMIFSQAVLDGATRTAARLVRTGQAQSNADPLGTFTNALCSNLAGVIPCGSVAVDVESFGTFSSVTPAPVTKDKNGKVTNNTWGPGGPGAAVDVRAFYTYHFFLPFVANVLNPSGNGVVLQSTVIFKNEPYPVAGP